MTYEEYANHDCHLSPDSGCSVCEAWWTEHRYRDVQAKLGIELQARADKDLYPA